MTEQSTRLTAARWTRYGKDRVYVNDPAGARVGWVDLQTGHTTIERPELADAFERAVKEYVIPPRGALPDSAAANAPTTAPTTSPSAAPPMTAGESELRDLALNRPGQAARGKAGELRAEMRQRSRIAAFVLRAVDAKTEERAFRVGAKGEETVGPRLERLTKRGWHVLHAIPVGSKGADIDHLLIGPGGVYTVNTKHHPGGRIWVGEREIRVNGQRTDYLRNSRYEAQRAHAILRRATGIDLPVRPALIFLTGTVIPQVTIKQMPPDVLVLDRTDIPRVFQRAPRRIDAATIERAFAVARRSTTWVASSRAPRPPAKPPRHL